MNTQEIELNLVHAASSPTGKALEVKPARKEIPSPDGSGDEGTTGKNHPIPAPGKEEPSLVVVPSPNPPPSGGPG